MLEQRRPVPVRTIMATIGLVVLTVVALYLAIKLVRIEGILIVAAFFAVVLTPPTELVQRYLHVRRTLAASIVFLVGLALVGGMLYAFIRPIVDQGQHFADRLPTLVKDAKAGKGTVGHIVKRYKLDDYVQKNKDKLQKSLTHLGTGALKVAQSVAAYAAILITTFFLAFLMILYGPEMLRGGLNALSPPTATRIRLVAGDCARALTGYVFGNLLISLIAGVVTFVGLFAFGVPFRGVLALWVGFADLIPLVGATLGAVPTVAVAFLHSTAAGIGMIIVFVVYQQFENHVLQVVIMAKTVQINQLVVLVSVLIGVELAGFVGALLAIPAAGVIQVVARDLWDHRRGTLREVPTVGADKVPAHEADGGRADPSGQLPMRGVG